MSITFTIEGTRSDPELPETYVNLANGNARELLTWLGIPAEIAAAHFGRSDSTALAARCRRRLWPEERNVDPGRPAVEVGRLIDCGRRPGYLPERAAELLALCERAGRRRIVWG